MKPGPVDYYKRWRVQKGKPKQVEAIEFISYYRQGDNLVIFKVKGKRYIGEKWMCIIDGKKKKLMFRVEYFGRTKDSSKRKPIADYTPNPITDSRYACEQGDWRKNEMNVILYKMEQKDALKYDIIHKISQKYPNECVRDGARLLKDFYDKAFNSNLTNTPIYPAALWSKYKVWQDLNPDCAIFLNYIINMNL